MEAKEIEELAEEKYCRSGYGTWDANKLHHRVKGFVEGFQSAEVALFSKEDMIVFSQWIAGNYIFVEGNEWWKIQSTGNQKFTTKKILEEYLKQKA